MLPTPIDYPSEIVVGCAKYRIQWCEKIPSKNRRDVGLCDGTNKTIYLKAGYSHAETLSTLFHELIHAFEFEYDMELDHKHVYKLEVAISDFLVANLSKFLARNP